MESKPSFWTASVKGDVYEVDWGIFENYACESKRFLFKYLSRKIKLHFRFIEIIVLLTIKV